MTRDQFSKEFMRGMRFVIQKHDRAVAARVEVKLLSRNPLFEPRDHTAVVEAENNLDAAILQLGDHLFDALEKSGSAHATDE